MIDFTTGMIGGKPNKTYKAEGAVLVQEQQIVSQKKAELSIHGTTDPRSGRWQSILFGFGRN